jgi:pimeloyl-ACP methyl ester carboxylesterase
MNRTLPGLVGLAGILMSGCAQESVDDEPGNGAADVVAATPLAEACTRPDIVSLERPHLHAKPNGAHFTYRVRFRKPARPDAVTVVHLPGGPGLPSIGEDPGWAGKELGLVQTDPRGVGCNPAKIDDPAAFYRSAELAEDVIAAIEKLGLTNYVLHGHSYGTSLATRVAHLLAKRNLPKPKAVLLEGVIARAFDDKWMGQAYVDEWEAYMKELPPEAVSELAKGMPLGIDGRIWGAAFMVLSSQLGQAGTAAFLGKLAHDANGKPDLAAREELAEMVKKLGAIAPTTGAGHTLQRFVACREISKDIPDDNNDVVLDHGKLVKSPEAGTLCTGLDLADKFEVKDHSYPFRTFYFLGERDPATPVWQGKLHFDTLRSADRVELVVAGAGHLILDSMGSCVPSLIERAAAGSGFSDALGTCEIAAVPAIRVARQGE